MTDKEKIPRKRAKKPVISEGLPEKIQVEKRVFEELKKDTAHWKNIANNWKATAEEYTKEFSDYAKEKAIPVFKEDAKKFWSLDKWIKYIAVGAILAAIAGPLLVDGCRRKQIDKLTKEDKAKVIEIAESKTRTDSMHAELKALDKLNDTLMIMALDNTVRIKTDQEGAEKRQQIKYVTNEIKKRISDPDSDRDAIWQDIKRTREAAKNN